MKNRSAVCVVLFLGGLGLRWIPPAEGDSFGVLSAAENKAPARDRSPVDLVLTPDECVAADGESDFRQRVAGAH